MLAAQQQHQRRHYPRVIIHSKAVWLNFWGSNIVLIPRKLVQICLQRLQRDAFQKIIIRKNARQK